MGKFDKTLKLMGKAVEGVAPEAKEVAKKGKKLPWWASSEEEVAKEAARQKLLDIQDRQKAAGLVPSDMPQPPPPRPAQEGPTTLEGSNKLFNPEMSGKINYKPTAKAMMPMAAAQDMFKNLQDSPLGDVATQWNKIKAMLSDKAAKEMDLTGGKDPQFQKNASAVLGTTLDPVNFIPGVGGVAAGAAEMLGRDEEEDPKKKKLGMP